MKRETPKKKSLEAIKKYCLICCGLEPENVKCCLENKCPLYSFRFGTDPYRKSYTMTEEEKEKRRMRMYKVGKANKEQN